MACWVRWTVYVVQMGRDRLGREEVNNILDTHASQVEILNTVSWSYFPRWSPTEAGQGWHWQVLVAGEGEHVVWRGLCVI